MTDILKILDDLREIKRLVYDTYSEQVGRDGVEKIEAYGEPGEYCMRPWFAIWRGGVIVRRVNANEIFAVDYGVDAE